VEPLTVAAACAALCAVLVAVGFGVPAPRFFDVVFHLLVRRPHAAARRGAAQVAARRGATQVTLVPLAFLAYILLQLRRDESAMTREVTRGTPRGASAALHATCHGCTSRATVATSRFVRHVQRCVARGPVGARRRASWRRSLTAGRCVRCHGRPYRVHRPGPNGRSYPQALAHASWHRWLHLPDVAQVTANGIRAEQP
jgi:hypothetical protein